jgi:hypothetical protein
VLHLLQLAPQIRIQRALARQNMQCLEGSTDCPGHGSFKTCVGFTPLPYDLLHCRQSATIVAKSRDEGRAWDTAADHRFSRGYGRIQHNRHRTRRKRGGVGSVNDIVNVAWGVAGAARGEVSSKTMCS